MHSSSVRHCTPFAVVSRKSNSNYDVIVFILCAQTHSMHPAHDSKSTGCALCILVRPLSQNIYCITSNIRTTRREVCAYARLQTYTRGAHVHVIYTGVPPGFSQSDISRERLSNSVIFLLLSPAEGDFVDNTSVKIN